MPQLWLTYQEIADELGCTPAQARDTAIASVWTRKHSRDGFTRVMLPDAMMRAYFRARAAEPAPAPLSALEQLSQIWTGRSSSPRL